MARKDRQIAELVTPGRLDKPIVVLRKVNVAPMSRRPHKNAPSVMERIGSGYIEQGVEEKETVWFANGYLLNDQPRTSGLTDEIVKNTIGFAVARSDSGEIIREGGPNSLAEMEAIAGTARVEVTVGVAGLEDDYDENEAAIAAAEAEAAAQAEAEAQAQAEAEAAAAATAAQGGDQA